jgi:hypothetical protein
MRQTHTLNEESDRCIFDNITNVQRSLPPHAEASKRRGKRFHTEHRRKKKRTIVDWHALMSGELASCLRVLACLADSLTRRLGRFINDKADSRHVVLVHFAGLLQNFGHHTRQLLKGFKVCRILPQALLPSVTA